MKNTIKIIDLLNKIANGEEVPKKIRWGHHELEYNKKYNDYVVKDEYGKPTFLEFVITEYYVLNDEVEVIEESKKIDNIRKYYDDEIENYVAETFTNNNFYKEIYSSKYDEMMICKVNELIDEVNKMKEGK